MNIYEKLGDFLLNLIQLVVGGIVFALIMADDSINTIWLYSIAVGIVVIMFISALLLFKVSKKKNKKED